MVGREDEKAAFLLIFVAIASILLARLTGAAVPLDGKRWRLLSADSSFSSTTKLFEARVILATRFMTKKL